MQIIPLTGQGSGATATATLSTGAVSSVAVTAAGSSYLAPPVVTVAGGGGTGATLVATLNAAGGIATIAVTAGGSGYSSPVVTITPVPGGPAVITATGALPPTAGQDISGLTTGTFTWCVEVLSLTAAKALSLALELSVNAFGASTIADVKQFLGQEGQGGTTFAFNTFTVNTDKRSTVVRQQLPFSAVTYFGVASALARVNVTGISASAQAAINSWIEVG